MYHHSIVPASSAFVNPPRLKQEDRVKFHQAVESAVEKVLQLHATDVVGLSDPAGKQLLRVFDKFFSQGLISRDRSYWKVMKRLLPRTEIELLLADTGKLNDRHQSVAWLKSIFNNASFLFLISSLDNDGNKCVLKRFYDESALTLDRLTLKVLDTQNTKLSNIMFSFELRPTATTSASLEPVYVSTEHTPNKNTVNQRLQSDSRVILSSIEDESETTSPLFASNELPTIAVPIKNDTEQDLVFDELISQRELRKNKSSYQLQVETVVPKEQPSPQDAFKGFSVELENTSALKALEQIAREENEEELAQAERLKEALYESDQIIQDALNHVRISLTHVEFSQMVSLEFGDGEFFKACFKAYLLQESGLPKIVLIVVSNKSVFVMQKVDDEDMPLRKIGSLPMDEEENRIMFKYWNIDTDLCIENQKSETKITVNFLCYASVCSFLADFQKVHQEITGIRNVDVFNSNDHIETVRRLLHLRPLPLNFFKVVYFFLERSDVFLPSLMASMEVTEMTGFLLKREEDIKQLMCHVKDGHLKIYEENEGILVADIDLSQNREEVSDITRGIRVFDAATNKTRKFYSPDSTIMTGFAEAVKKNCDVDEQNDNFLGVHMAITENALVVYQQLNNDCARDLVRIDFPNGTYDSLTVDVPGGRVYVLIIPDGDQIHCAYFATPQELERATSSLGIIQESFDAAALARFEYIFMCNGNVFHH